MILALLLHFYLTADSDPTTSMTLNLHATEPKVEIALNGKKRSFRGEPFQGRWLYHIHLTHLTPDSEYNVIVDSKEKKFRTLPLKPPYRFVEGGDWEYAKEGEKLAKTAATLSPHLCLLGGDYTPNVLSTADLPQWDDWLSAYEKSMITPSGHLIPLVAAIGNHEVFSGGFNRSPASAPFFYHFLRSKQNPSSYYSLAIGKEMLITILDSGHTAPFRGEQSDWLDQTLDQPYPLKFALYHVPLYPSVRFKKKTFAYHLSYFYLKILGNDAVAQKLLCPQSAEGENVWGPLFDKYKVDVCFEHHDQTLKRTALLRAGKKNPSGTLYLGDGSIAPKYHFFPIQRLLTPYFEKVMSHQNFFWLVDIDGEKVLFQALDQKKNVLDKRELSRL